jgi:hypothetical protein
MVIKIGKNLHYLKLDHTIEGEKILDRLKRKRILEIKSKGLIWCQGKEINYRMMGKPLDE